MTTTNKLAEVLAEAIGKSIMGNEHPFTEEIYSRAELVAFGNYLLSDGRKEITGFPNEVTHADIENFKELDKLNPTVKL